MQIPVSKYRGHNLYKGNCNYGQDLTYVAFTAIMVCWNSVTGMVTGRRSEKSQEASRREEGEDTRNGIVCSPDANYLSRIWGITEDNNFRESLSELLLPCDRAGPAQMKPAEH